MKKIITYILFIPVLLLGLIKMLVKKVIEFFDTDQVKILKDKALLEQYAELKKVRNGERGFICVEEKHMKFLNCHILPI